MNEIFIKNLKETRLRRNLTIKELAELSGVSKSAISKYELGESVPSVDNVIELAKILNVTLSFLIGEGGINKEDKSNYITKILHKHGLDTPFINPRNLSNEELINFENDIILMMKVIKEKYKL